ncbi:MAG: IMP cyclohydrolase, partial [Clostridiales bacterium]
MTTLTSSMEVTPMIDIQDYLSKNEYPGRGVLLGITGDGSHAALAYFIMGRSINSRNRIFTAND